jgi:hypothetical protein
MQMRKVSLIVAAAVALHVAIFSAAPARAQANRTVVDSVAADNVNGAGVLIPTLSGPMVTLINTRFTNNQVGVNAGGGAPYLAETTISGNTGNGFIVRPGATVFTVGNNRITDTANSGALTRISAPITDPGNHREQEAVG